MFVFQIRFDWRQSKSAVKDVPFHEEEHCSIYTVRITVNEASLQDYCSEIIYFKNNIVRHTISI